MERERPSDDPRQASTTAPPPGAPRREAEPRIAREYRPLGKPVRLISTAEALLRVPGRILFELRNGNARPLAGMLLALAAACFLAFGLTVGTFSGGDQLWAAPLKIAGGAALCALICFPSLVVFTLLSGSETTIGEIFVLVSLQMMTTLRPIVGSGDRLLQPGKKFFLTHWAETLDEAPPRRARQE